MPRKSSSSKPKSSSRYVAMHYNVYQRIEHGFNILDTRDRRYLNKDEAVNNVAPDRGTYIGTFTEICLG